jgi:hypothetical protein
MTAKYFCGDIELNSIWGEPNARFLAIGGKPSKHNYYDSFKRLVGTDGKALFPVERTIYYKKHPSLHKCDGRCLHAKGQNCECACGGKNHGLGG